MFKELLNRLLNNDQPSQRILFEMFYQRIYNTAYFITQDHHAAHDVTQETFIKAFRQLHTLKDGNKMGAWLGRIAANTAADYLRKIKRWNDFSADDVFIEEEISKQQEAASVDEIVEGNFIHELLYAKMSELKPEYRQVLVLKYEFDMKDEEIAEALGVSAGTVKSRLYRAKNNLKSRIAEQLDEERRGSNATT